jgi:EAL domain-containing protein (putative c-di-GMP-specific phosphodiesterase class I)
MMQPETKQLETWAESQNLSFELVLNTKDLVTEFVTLTSIEEAPKEAVLDLIKEGIRAANYWHSFTKPHAIMLTMKVDCLLDSDLMHAFQELLLKCHLPVGLIHVGISDLVQTKEISQLDEALVQLQRLGILFHLLNFTGQEAECQLMLNHRFTHIHIAGDLIRQAIPGSQCEKKLIALKALIQANDSRSVTGPIKLMHEKSVAEKHAIDCYFGKHIMPPMTLHQVLKMGRTAKQQLAIRQLIKKQSDKE